MEEVLDESLSGTLKMITQMIEIECAHINVNHPDFIGGGQTLLNLFQQNDEANRYTLMSSNNAKESIYENNDK